MFIPPGEKIVETKMCPLTGKKFHITDRDLVFYDSVSPIIGGKKYFIPTPLLSPDARDMRRLAWSNEQYLYNRECDRTGKKILSEYAPDNPRPIWDFRAWNSDSYNPLAYGREIDFDTSLVQQFHELEQNVPHPNVATDMDNENSDYIHQAGHAKNSYLMFHASYIEDCYYGYGVKKAKSCVDCYYAHESEFCYESVDIKGCSSVKWSQSCQNCQESSFLLDCIGCSQCFMCYGLRNKSYCILNKQYSKEEYLTKISELSIYSAQDVIHVRNRFEVFVQNQPIRNDRNVMVENVHGNYLYQAKDTFHSYDCSDIQDCKYCTQLQLGTKNCYDMYQFGINMDHCLDTSQTGYNISNCLFSYALIDNCTNLMYCFNCFSSRDSLLCYGLKKNKYCILNKQYSESEYQILAGKCIDKLMQEGQWGEHLHPRYSHIPYNDSMAQQWYPIDAEKAHEQGYGWIDETKRSFPYAGSFYQPLPIDQYDENKVGPDQAQKNIDACLGGVLKCESSKKPFRLISQELLYYIENGIPIPVLHPDVRRNARFLSRDKRNMGNMDCASCHKNMYTPHHDRGNVFCHDCYRDRVY